MPDPMDTFIVAVALAAIAVCSVPEVVAKLR